MFFSTDAEKTVPCVHYLTVVCLDKKVEQPRSIINRPVAVPLFESGCPDDGVEDMTTIAV
jgi:hypothetical protein